MRFKHPETGEMVEYWDGITYVSPTRAEWKCPRCDNRVSLDYEEGAMEEAIPDDELEDGTWLLCLVCKTPVMEKHHDDKGLYEKYFVLKPGSREDHDGVLHFVEDFDRFVNRKTTPCFVLSPEKRDEYGLASRMALMTYAQAIVKKNPKLSEDLIEWFVRVYANMADDGILESYGIEIPEGGTLTTDEVEIDPDAPKMKVEMDLSELEKAVAEEEAPAESMPDVEDRRLLEALKVRLADERFARKVTAMQRDIALAGRDRLLREKLKLPGEDQQDAEALKEMYYPSSEYTEKKVRAATGMAEDEAKAMDVSVQSIAQQEDKRILEGMAEAQRCGWCGEVLDDCKCLRGKHDPLKVEDTLEPPRRTPKERVGEIECECGWKGDSARFEWDEENQEPTGKVECPKCGADLTDRWKLAVERDDGVDDR